jgi:glycosyltransferase involved in cell wall biosynthesis
MTEQRPLKVLVAAYAFSPIRGSEFATGWDYVRAIAARHRVWVIARSNEQQQTEEFLHQHSEVLHNVRVHYVPFTSRSFSYPLGEIPYYFLYRYWQWRAYRLGRTLDKTFDFDLVHHINGTGFREPGYLWKLAKPFVWGPVNGLQFFPLKLSSAVPFRSRIFFAVKNLSTLWAMHLAQRPKLAATRASAIIAATTTAAAGIKRLWGRESTLLCEVSVSDWEPKPPARRSPGEPLRIIWAGTCEPRKALNIVLYALDRLRESPVGWQLIAIGTGAQGTKWKTLAATLGIADRCSFLGKLPRAEVLRVMAAGHCFVQPSLYDGTPTVVAEALAHGLPVICLDQFGCKDVISSACGVKIAPNNLDQIIRDFAEAIRFLWQNEESRYAMALGAQRAARRLSYKYKEKVINQLYASVLVGGRLADPSPSCRHDRISPQLAKQPGP